MAHIVTRDVLKRRLAAGEDLVLVDVRAPESYWEQHLPGAVSLPVDTIDETTTQGLPRDKEIVVYCASFECQASPRAAQVLEALGFPRVTDFEGGLEDWKNAGYPVERAEAAA